MAGKDGRPRAPTAKLSHETPKAEFLTAAAIVSGLSLAYTVGSDWIPRLVSGPPLLVHIDSSQCTDPANSIHTIAFTIENISNSGVYLDMIELKRPSHGAFSYLVRRSNQGGSMGLGDLGSRKIATPTSGQMRTTSRPNELIGRGKYVELVLQLPCPDSDEFWRKPYGTLAMTIAPLNEKKPLKPVEIDFRLRRPI